MRSELYTASWLLKNKPIAIICSMLLSSQHKLSHANPQPTQLTPRQWRTTFNSQDGQVPLELIFGNLSLILVPLYLLVLDEGMKNMVTKGSSHYLAFLSEQDSLQ